MLSDSSELSWARDFDFFGGLPVFAKYFLLWATICQHYLETQGKHKGEDGEAGEGGGEAGEGTGSGVDGGRGGTGDSSGGEGVLGVKDKVLGVKYEHLLGNTAGNCRVLYEACGLDASAAENCCGKVLDRDHHEGGIFSSRRLRGQHAPDPGNDAELRDLMLSLARRLRIEAYISEDAVLPGTITQPAVRQTEAGRGGGGGGCQRGGVHGHTDTYGAPVGYTEREDNALVGENN